LRWVFCPHFHKTILRLFFISAILVPEKLFTTHFWQFNSFFSNEWSERENNVVSLVELNINIVHHQQ